MTEGKTKTKTTSDERDKAGAKKKGPATGEDRHFGRPAPTEKARQSQGVCARAPSNPRSQQIAASSSSSSSRGSSDNDSPSQASPSARSAARRHHSHPPGPAAPALLVSPARTHHPRPHCCRTGRLGKRLRSFILDPTGRSARYCRPSFFLFPRPVSLGLTACQNRPNTVSGSESSSPLPLRPTSFAPAPSARSCAATSAAPAVVTRWRWWGGAAPPRRRGPAHRLASLARWQ